MRAARAWAGLTQQELAERLDVKVLTVKRLEGAERTDRPNRGPSHDHLLAVGAACGVPPNFMLHGWDLHVALVLTNHETTELARSVAQRTSELVTLRLFEHVEKLSDHELDDVLRQAVSTLRSSRSNSR